MIIVAGEFVIAPEDAATARAAAIEVARETRKEPGCVAYRFWADLEEAGRYHVFEIWESLAALQAHFETPHLKAFRAKLGAIKVISREVRRYEAGPGVAL
jgi:quinol monooxygenase YgiN